MGARSKSGRSRERHHPRRESAGSVRPIGYWPSLKVCDFAYVTNDQAETSVLFELISARYEQRSMLITANQPFGQWEAIFPDGGMTVAAIDRLVHGASIFELNVDSYRRRTAIENKRTQRRRPEAPSTATDQADSSSQEDRGRLTPPHSPPPSIQTALGPKSALPVAAAEKSSSIAAPQRVYSRRCCQDAPRIRRFPTNLRSSGGPITDGALRRHGASHPRLSAGLAERPPPESSSRPLRHRILSS